MTSGKSVALAVLLAAGLTGSAWPAQQKAESKVEAPAAENANYTSERGIVSIPLVVKENLGVERRQWPASFGVPFPAGVLKEPTDLRLLDASGKEVPCQFSALARYWGRDNSVRWVLLDFQADVPANSNAVYRLTNDKPAAPVTGGIVVKDDADTVTVSNGGLEARISKRSANLFESVSIGGKEIVKASERDGPRCTTDAQDFTRHFGGSWNTHGWTGLQIKEKQNPIKRADYFGDAGAPEEVVVERNGPMHVIVRVCGAYLPIEKGKEVLEHGPYNFTYRLHFYRGKDYARVEYTMENSRFEEPRFQTRVMDHSLWVSTLLKGDLACTYGNVNGQTGEGVAKAGGVFSVYGKKAEEDRVQWLDVRADGRRVGAAIRLSRGAPQALDVVDGRLVVRPFAIYYGEANPLSAQPLKCWGRGGWQLDFGSRQTYDIFYRFAADGGGTDLAALAKGMRWPLFGFAPPEWYADTGTWNMELSPGMAMFPQRPPAGHKAGEPYNPYSRDAADSAPHRQWNLNSGGNHPNLSSLNDFALMRGDLQELQKNFWIVDDCVGDFMQWNYRHNEPSRDQSRLEHAFQMQLYSSKDLYLYGGQGQSLGSYMLSYKYLPDSEHYGMLWLFEHFYLWGDERTRESLKGFANWSVLFEWAQMFRGFGQKGIPPLDQVDYFDKNREALRKSHYARIYFWQLYTPIQAYQATGNPVYDLIVKWQLRRLSHLQRLSRGIPEAWTSSYWDSAKQKAWRIIDYPAELMDFIYSAQTWQVAMITLAFHEAWKTYGDEEILDNLWGEADYFRQVPWRGPGQGIPNRTLTPAACMGQDYNSKEFTPNYHMITGQALSLAWLYTGDPELKKRMEDHVEKGRLARTTWGFMPAWVKDRKDGRDKAPDAVTDLVCASAGRDGLKFTWTAPKGYGKSGRAARYFLKYSAKPLVKWAAVSNPDAPADPVLDKMKHTYKPECWHPDFLKKDAFWMATHVEGEPVPGEPGNKEACAVTVAKPHNYYGLPLEKMLKVKDWPAGKYYFALCSWDEDNNLSDLSNVVEVNLSDPGR